MADVTVTASGVKYGSGSTLKHSLTAGETIIHGDWVYLKASDKKYWKALNTSADSATSSVVGVAITPAAADGVFSIIQAGSYYPGGTPLTEGAAYALSSTSGALAPVADVGSTDYLTLLGGAVSTSELKVQINVTGGQVV